MQDWLEHKNDDVLFEQVPGSNGMQQPVCVGGFLQEGVPRDWWAIEPRFFQPKASEQQSIIVSSGTVNELRFQYVPCPSKQSEDIKSVSLFCSV